MPPRCEPTLLTVALVGNPNAGKSTLFSALVGVRQRVGNYPGVTVEKKTGRLVHAECQYELVDLPGLYSLAPRSRDEMVAVDLLLGRDPAVPAPAAVIAIVDAGNLQRHLYLVSQVLELGLPTVLALNMVDIAAAHGIAVDAEKLRRRLGIPVVVTQANRGVGVAELKAALDDAVRRGPRPPASPLPEPVEDEVTRIESLMAAEAADSRPGQPAVRYLARRLLLDSSGYLERVLLASSDGPVRSALGEARRRLAEGGHTVPAVETASRHHWVRRTLDGVVTRPSQYRVTLSDRIDHVLTSRIWGTLFFATLMVVVFQSVFVWAEPAIDGIEAVVDAAGGWLRTRMAEGALRSLLVEGVFGGVGGVLAFLPQIVILFFFIAVLEDCGYMARAAFLMDRFMSRLGLSGKSFIPMLSSFACAIPGVMAARVIENERDRLTTILVAPLMTCSARLPVYALLIAAFIPARAFWGGLVNLQGLTLAALYALGIAAAVLTALALKRTILRGETPPFVMELPSYKWPSPRTVCHRVLARAWSFVRCAGTLILTVSILVWAALYYPHDEEAIEGPYRARVEQLESRLHSAAGDADRGAAAAELRAVEREIHGEYQRQSLLGRAGRLIEPVFRPLGWDWRIGSAVLASFPAREVVVATLGVMFNLGDEVDVESGEDSSEFAARLHAARWEGTGRPLFTLPVALSVMVFYALCAQCAATLAVIRRETNSWRWPLFSFIYMTMLAYSGAFLTYQVGTWLGGR